MLLSVISSVLWGLLRCAWWYGLTYVEPDHRGHEPEGSRQLWSAGPLWIVFFSLRSMVAVPLSAGVSGAWLCGNEGV